MGLKTYLQATIQAHCQLEALFTGGCIIQPQNTNNVMLSFSQLFSPLELAFLSTLLVSHNPKMGLNTQQLCS